MVIINYQDSTFRHGILSTCNDPSHIILSMSLETTILSSNQDYMLYLSICREPFIRLFQCDRYSIKEASCHSASLETLRGYRKSTESRWMRSRLQGNSIGCCFKSLGNTAHALFDTASAGSNSRTGPVLKRNLHISIRVTLTVFGLSVSIFVLCAKKDSRRPEYFRNFCSYWNFTSAHQEHLTLLYRKPRGKR